MSSFLEFCRGFNVDPLSNHRMDEVAPTSSMTSESSSFRDIVSSLGNDDDDEDNNGSTCYSNNFPREDDDRWRFVSVPSQSLLLSSSSSSSAPLGLMEFESLPKGKGSDYDMDRSYEPSNKFQRQSANSTSQFPFEYSHCARFFPSHKFNPTHLCISASDYTLNQIAHKLEQSLDEYRNISYVFDHSECMWSCRFALDSNYCSFQIRFYVDQPGSQYALEFRRLEGDGFLFINIFNSQKGAFGTYATQAKISSSSLPSLSSISSPPFVHLIPIENFEDSSSKAMEMTIAEAAY